MKKQLLLISARYCPFCVKVEQFLQQNHIVIPTVHLEDKPHYREELLLKGGLSQVPCLKIDDNYLYESEDIIQWVKTNNKSHD